MYILLRVTNSTLGFLVYNVISMLWTVKNRSRTVNSFDQWVCCHFPSQIFILGLPGPWRNLENSVAMSKQGLTDLTHSNSMHRQFQPKCKVFGFLLKICLNLHNLKLFICGHCTAYTSLHSCVQKSGWCRWERSKVSWELEHKACCLVWLVLISKLSFHEESWKWFPILFFLVGNVHTLCA